MILISFYVKLNIGFVIIVADSNTHIHTQKCINTETFLTLGSVDNLCHSYRPLMWPLIVFTLIHFSVLPLGCGESMCVYRIHKENVHIVT